MTKLLKNSKQVLAFVFAIAVLASSLFTGVVASAVCANEKIDLLEFGSYLTEAGSSSTYYDTKVDDNGETGDSWENAIIIDSAEEFVYLAKASGNETAGKYYKVADGIDGFDLSKGDLDLNGTLADNLDKIKASGKNHAGNTPGFQGNFDGNGVTVYGAWCNHTSLSSYAGLFSCVKGDVTIKNINVKLSYFIAKSAAGGIVGYYEMHNNTKVGSLNIENCTVTECYIESTGTGYGCGAGAVVGYAKNSYKDANDVYQNGKFNIKNCYVNFKEENLVSASASNNMALHGGLAAYATTNAAVFSDCIVIGVTPYATTKNTEHNNHQHTALESHFKNVYTDKPAGKVNIGGKSLGVRDFTGKIFQFDADKLVGGYIATVATELDWKNTWVTGADGYPDLRSNHGKFVDVEENPTTHGSKCSDCGFVSYGTATSEKHDFVTDKEPKGDGKDVYYCRDCKYVCKHGDMTQPTVEPGDCLTAPGTYTRCNLCDWYFADNLGAPLGHQFTYVPADPGHCAADGRAEYWYCVNCDKKYVTNNVLAPYEEAVTDADLNTGLGLCIKDENDDGVVVIRDESGHYFICKIDGGRLDYECNKIPSDEVEEHDYKDGVCYKCGWKCPKHDYKLTGNIAVVGDCVTDEEAELKCNICKYKTSVVTKKAAHKIVKKDEVMPTDKMEGTKSHYKCTVCNEIYADAEGKTKVTAASLVIPKVLPEEYRDMINADISNKSPSTSDSVASVLAVAALAGAVLVIARKK